MWWQWLCAAVCPHTADGTQCARLQHPVCSADISQRRCSLLRASTGEACRWILDAAHHGVVVAIVQFAVFHAAPLIAHAAVGTCLRTAVALAKVKMQLPIDRRSWLMACRVLSRTHSLDGSAAVVRVCAACARNGRSTASIGARHLARRRQMRHRGSVGHACVEQVQIRGKKATLTLAGRWLPYHALCCRLCECGRRLSRRCHCATWPDGCIVVQTRLCWRQRCVASAAHYSAHTNTQSSSVCTGANQSVAAAQVLVCASQCRSLRFPTSHPAHIHKNNVAATASLDR